ncbi:hypothetical protein yaldo0001_27180 [Yersinia aldovae ATCC 35236]|nr:hypothetical protein yaldo0001_27180 [Yersinia aldovae ATCC 35236]
MVITTQTLSEDSEKVNRNDNSYQSEIIIKAGSLCVTHSELQAQYRGD